MKILSIIFFTFFFVDSNWLLDFQVAQNKAKESNKLILVNFSVSVKSVEMYYRRSAKMANLGDDVRDSEKTVCPFSNRTSAKASPMPLEVPVRMK